MRLEKSSGNGSGRVFKAVGGLLSLFQEQVESREGPVVWWKRPGGRGRGEPYALCFTLNRVPLKDMLKS